MVSLCFPWMVGGCHHGELDKPKWQLVINIYQLIEANQQLLKIRWPMLSSTKNYNHNMWNLRDIKGTHIPQNHLRSLGDLPTWIISRHNNSCWASTHRPHHGSVRGPGVIGLPLLRLRKDQRREGGGSHQPQQPEVPTADSRDCTKSRSNSAGNIETSIKYRYKYRLRFYSCSAKK